MTLCDLTIPSLPVINKGLHCAGVVNRGSTLVEFGSRAIVEPCEVKTWFIFHGTAMYEPWFTMVGARWT